MKIKWMRGYVVTIKATQGQGECVEDYIVVVPKHMTQSVMRKKLLESLVQQKDASYALGLSRTLPNDLANFVCVLEE